jgi:hypothetical protein
VSSHWEEHLARLRERQLSDLRWHWGEAYEFSWADGRYLAARRDTGEALACQTGEGLFALVMTDHERSPVPREADEYPQAVADDYPGWEVGHAGGRWTARCPALTLHASTAAGLRAAIERAICGDDPAWDDPA